MTVININDGDDIAPHLDGDLSGQHIEIPPGTYQRNSACYTTLDNTTIEPASDGDVIIEGEENAHRFEWTCTGDSTVRGLTFKGVRPEGGNGQDMTNSSTTDSNAELLFLECRWPDGSVDPSDTHGMYVRNDHVGVVTFRRCEISGFGDNGIYGSSMGSSGGEVHVEDSEFYHNNIAAVRIGGSGSYVKDSYFEVDDSQTPAGLQGHSVRGVWSRKDGDYLIENCDFVFNSSGHPIWTLSGDVQGGTTTVNNCRIQQNGSGYAIYHRTSDHTLEGSGNHLTGTSDTDASQVFECIQNSCDVPWNGDNFSIISESSGDLDYTLTVTDGVRRITGHEYPAEESNDNITDNGDGTYTVSGFTATANEGDTYEVRGQVTDVSISTPEQSRADFRLEQNGDDVTDQYFSPDDNTIGISDGEDIAPYLDGTHTNETIEIPPGTYSRSSEMNITLDNATIECVEGQAVIDSGDGHNLGVEWVASGDSAVRNVTFAGERGQGGPGQQHAVEVNSGGTLTFDNVRWPDGAVQGTAHAMYVRSGHSGVVEFTGCYFEGFPDNAIYGSAPGATGGELHVSNSEFYHNNVASVRFGGGDSYVENSYFEVDESQVTPIGSGAVTARGVWIHSDGQNYRVENNDFVFNTPDGSPIQDHPDGSGATTEVLNNRIQQNGSAQAIDLGRGNATGSGNHLTGSGNLDSSHESIVACRGSGCDLPENVTDDDPWSGHNFAVISETEGELDYTLTVTDGVRFVTDNDYPAEENNDSITDNGDGTYTVDGLTGNAGYGDTFEIRGEVTDVTINTAEENRAEFRLERDGTDVTTEYFPPESQDVSVTFTQDGIQEVVIDGNVEWEANSE